MRNLHTKDNKISLKGLIEFYADLLEKGTISVGGAGHNRMRSLVAKSSIGSFKFSDTVHKYL